MHSVPHTHSTNSTSDSLATTGDEETSFSAKAKDHQGDANERLKDKVMKMQRRFV